MSGTSLLALLGAQSPPAEWAASLGIAPTDVAVKTLGHVTYHSVPSHGLSLQYEGEQGCQAVDVYNAGALKGWQGCPLLPLTLALGEHEERSFTLTPSTTGKEFVERFGEPTRKGGGEPLRGGGASGLGPGAWMEWQGVRLHGRTVHLMVELAGADARGAQRWEREKGGAALWGVLTISLPSDSAKG